MLENENVLGVRWSLSRKYHVTGHRCNVIGVGRGILSTVLHFIHGAAHIELK